MAFLHWLEDTGLATGIRESILMYPFILTLHGVGMAFLVGLNAMIDLRMLGFAPNVPLGSMERFFPIMWFGFWLNLVTGVLLLVQAATQHMIDPVMVFKLAMVTLAIVVMRRQRTLLLRVPAPVGAPVVAAGRALAITSLALWTLAITAGRLTAYTFFRFWS